MTPVLPPDLQAIVDQALADGHEVQIGGEYGGYENFSGNSVGAGQQASGDDLEMTVSGDPARVSASTGVASSGWFTI